MLPREHEVGEEDGDIIFPVALNASEADGADRPNKFKRHSPILPGAAIPFVEVMRLHAIAAASLQNNTPITLPQPAATPAAAQSSQEFRVLEAAESPRRPSTAEIKIAINQATPNKRRMSAVLDGLDLPNPNVVHAQKNTRKRLNSLALKGFRSLFYRDTSGSDLDAEALLPPSSNTAYYEFSQAEINADRKNFYTGMDGLSIFQSLRVCIKDKKFYGNGFSEIRHGKAKGDPKLLPPGGYAFAIVSNQTEVVNLTDKNKPNLIFRMKPLSQGAHKGLINLEKEKLEAVGEIFLNENSELCFLSTKSGHFFHLMAGIDQLKIIRLFFDGVTLQDKDFHAFQNNEEYDLILENRDLKKYIPENAKKQLSLSADNLSLDAHKKGV